MIRTSLRLVVLLALMIAGALPAAAQGLLYELKGGILGHDVPDLWSGFRLEHTAADINLEVMLAPALPILGGAIRPAIGGNINTRGDTSNAYVDARWQIDLPFGFYFGIGLGAAVHNGHTGPDSPTHKALGSRLLFHIPAELGYRFDAHSSISVYFEHTSNAYTQTYNEGMDRAGIRYGFRF